MVRVLVTGATGFIGLHLVRALVERGDTVLALVRNPDKARALPERVERVKGDLELFDREDFVLPDVDVVVHLAGVVAAQSPGEYERINHGAVVSLVKCLERSPKKPRRLLFASSLAAAGPSPVDRAWTEADPLAPIEPYGDAKARAEAVVAKCSVPTTSFRPCIVLGANDPASLTLYRTAMSGFGFRVGAPAQRLSFVDVRDVVTATLAMIDDTRPGHSVYFVSHPREIDVDVLWAALGRALGHRVRVVSLPAALLGALVPVSAVFSRLVGITNQLDDKQYRQMTAPAFVCSSAAITRDLGVHFAHDLDDTLAEAVRGYRESGLLR